MEIIWKLTEILKRKISFVVNAQIKCLIWEEKQNVHSMDKTTLNSNASFAAMFLFGFAGEQLIFVSHVIELLETT